MNGELGPEDIGSLYSNKPNKLQKATSSIPKPDVADLPIIDPERKNVLDENLQKALKISSYAKREGITPLSLQHMFKNAISKKDLPEEEKEYLMQNVSIFFDQDQKPPTKKIDSSFLNKKTASEMFESASFLEQRNGDFWGDTNAILTKDPEGISAIQAREAAKRDNLKKWFNDRGLDIEFRVPERLVPEGKFDITITDYSQEKPRHFSVDYDLLDQLWANKGAIGGGIALGATAGLLTLSTGGAAIPVFLAGIGGSALGTGAGTFVDHDISSKKTGKPTTDYGLAMNEAVDAALIDTVMGTLFGGAFSALSRGMTISKKNAIAFATRRAADHFKQFDELPSDWPTDKTSIFLNLQGAGVSPQKASEMVENLEQGIMKNNPSFASLSTDEKMVVAVANTDAGVKNIFPRASYEAQKKIVDRVLSRSKSILDEARKNIQGLNPKSEYSNNYVVEQLISQMEATKKQAKQNIDLIEKEAAEVISSKNILLMPDEKIIGIKDELDKIIDFSEAKPAINAALDQMLKMRIENRTPENVFNLIKGINKLRGGQPINPELGKKIDEIQNNLRGSIEQAYYQATKSRAAAYKWAQVYTETNKDFSKIKSLENNEVTKALLGTANRSDQGLQKVFNTIKNNLSISRDGNAVNNVQEFLDKLPKNLSERFENLVLEDAIRRHTSKVKNTTGTATDFYSLYHEVKHLTRNDPNTLTLKSKTAKEMIEEIRLLSVFSLDAEIKRGVIIPQHSSENTIAQSLFGKGNAFLVARTWTKIMDMLPTERARRNAMIEYFNKAVQYPFEPQRAEKFLKELKPKYRIQAGRTLEEIRRGLADKNFSSGYNYEQNTYSSPRRIYNTSLENMPTEMHMLPYQNKSDNIIELPHTGQVSGEVIELPYTGQVSDVPQSADVPYPEAQQKLLELEEQAPNVAHAVNEILEQQESLETKNLIEVFFDEKKKNSNGYLGTSSVGGGYKRLLPKRKIATLEILKKEGLLPKNATKKSLIRYTKDDALISMLEIEGYIGLDVGDGKYFVFRDAYDGIPAPNIAPAVD